MREAPPTHTSETNAVRNNYAQNGKNAMSNVQAFTAQTKETNSPSCCGYGREDCVNA